MDIRILRYFLAVARAENITRAAESLHIAQPSLSRQLMELEQEVGRPLLVRGKRKVTLTEDGILLRKRAEEIVALLEKTEQELTADAQTLTGQIALGGNPPPSVLQAGAALRRQYPGIWFSSYSSDATEVAERLDHGSLDFAVLLAPVDPMQYEFLPLPEQYHWGLLLRRDSPLAGQAVIRRQDLVREPLIFHRRAGLQRMIAHWAGQEPEQMNIAATYNVINGSPGRYAASGLGSVLTVQELLDPQPEEAVCFRPLDPPLTAQSVLVWKRYAVLSRPARKFLETIQASL